jgi:uncharacterized protein YbaP (TraB family)
MRLLRSLSCALVIAAVFVVPVHAQEPSTPHARNLRPVKVLGVVPGPDMWQVRRGSHVMWILGTLDELPQHMQWRAREVRAVIAQAGQVLDLPRVRIHASLGYFDRLALNPDGRQLRDVVPPQDYQKWLALKAQYIGQDDSQHDSVEQRRPVYAAIKLYLDALAQAGLSPDQIQPVIADLLKRNAMTLTPVIYREDNARSGDPVGAAHITQAMDLACFEATLDHLQADLPILQQRAQAWTSGDLETLAKLPMSDQLDVCRESLIASGASFQPDMADVRVKLRNAWLLAASNAIASHKVSFAMLPMADLLGADNYLDQLRAQGYRVDLPDSLGELNTTTRKRKP